jgi:type II secretory pathway pseudopilin PulG
VIAIVALLISILLPALGHARERSKRTKCAANLSGVGKALATYYTEWNTFPTQPPPGSKFGKWSLSPVGIDDPMDPIAYSYTDLGGGFYAHMGDPMANLWLMVMERRVTPVTFICPSDPLWPVPADTAYRPPAFSTGGVFLNFGAAGGKVTAGSIVVPTFSYSVSYPWVIASNIPVTRWRGHGTATDVLVADIGPSFSPPFDDPSAPAGTPASNSKNHGGSGQSVLFADFHVEFARRNDVGPRNGNIYATGTVFIKKGGKQFTVTTNVDTFSDPILAPARP